MRCPSPWRSRPLRWAALWCYSLPLLLACGPGGTGTVRSGEVLFQNCTPCHQADASGNRAVGAPAIAGQNVWYVQNQLRKFRAGLRGANPDDTTGQRMRPMSHILRSDEEVVAVAGYISSLPPRPGEPTLIGGDPEAGKARFAVCVTCHGDHAQGIEAQNKSPSLNRTNDWYALAQLKKFQAGIRGGSPADMEAFQMRPMSLTLPDEQAMKDVIAYIHTLSITQD